MSDVAVKTADLTSKKFIILTAVGKTFLLFGDVGGSGQLSNSVLNCQVLNKKPVVFLFKFNQYLQTL